jgi:anti-anti-sigma factor
MDNQVETCLSLRSVSIEAEMEGEAAERSHLRLRGDLDLASAPELEALLASRADDHDRFFVDMSEVAFLDSSGIRVLGRFGQELHMAGRTMVLRDPSKAARKVLEILQVSAWPGIEVDRL